MTLRTGLVISGDSRGAVDALENADRAMSAAQDEAAAMAAAYQRADASIGKLAKIQAEATAEINESKAALNAGQISLEQYNREILETKTALSLVEAEHRNNVTAIKQTTAAYNEAVQRGMRPVNDNLAEIGTAAAAASGSLSGINTGAAQSAAGLENMAGSSKLSASELLNLTFQVQDLGVQLASGGNPLIALVQQGSQIYGVMGQAGLGVRGFAREIAIATGIIRVSGNASLDAAARAAAANQAAIAAALARAEADGIAARAEVALARAALENAATASQSAAAQARLALATAAAATASAEATAATSALATAQASSAAAASAAGAAQTTSLTRLGAAGLAGAAALAVVAVGVGLLTAEVNKNSEMSISWQNVLLGAYDVISNAIVNEVTAYFKAFGLDVGQVWETIVDVTKMAINIIIGTAILLPRTLAATWDKIGPAIGDAFYSGVNLAIDALNSLLAAAAAPLNGLIGAFNTVFGKDIPAISLGSIDALANPYKGAMGRLGQAAGQAFTSSYGDHLGTAAKLIGPAAASRQAQENAEKAGKKVGGAMGRAAGQAAAKEAELSFADAFADISAVVDQMEAFDKLNEKLRTRLALAERELDLSGQTETAREALLRQLEEEERLRGVAEQRGQIAVAQAEAEANGLTELAAAYGRLLTVLDEVNAAEAGASARDEALRASEEATEAMLENLDAIADRAATIGDVFANAFGGIGSVIGDALAQMTDYNAAQADLADQVKRGAKTQLEAEKDLANLRAKNTASMLGGFKSLFKEHSTGYKIMGAIEKAHAAIQLFNTIQAIASDTQQTASAVANSATRATADGASGASKIFSQLGAWGFPVVAAMVALLAGLGVKGLSGGGGSAPVPASAEDTQAAIGTGTVLGDNSAQSESITRALDIMAENSNRALEFSNEAVQYLRAIEQGIGGLTAAVARQINVAGGSFDTSTFNLGQSGSSGFLGLFGSSTTRTVYDQGLETFQATVGDLLMRGVDAQVYTIVEQVKKKSGFLGIGGGTKTSYQTTTGGAPDEILRQFDLIIEDVTNGVIAFGQQLGIDVEQYLSAVVIPGAKLSFLGMSGEEIESALVAYFGSVADAITQGAFTAAGFNIAEFQKAGEGLFETLARLTRSMSTVSTSLRSINMADPFAGLGINERAAGSEALVGQFGDLDAFQDAVSAFSDAFLSEAERMQPVIEAVAAEMARLGYASVDTNDEFKALVRGLDLSTSAGQELFAQLLAVAPAFAKVNEYLEELNGTAASAPTAANIAAIAKERRAIEIELMEALGDAEGALAAKRADQLAALDATNRAIKQQVFDAQDAATAQRELAAAEAAAAREADALGRTKRSLELQILALIDPTAALAARRADELASLPESVRWMQERVFQLEDEQAAAAAAASAAAELAEQQRAAAEEAAAQARAIADERAGLESRLLQLQGDTAELRRRELDGLNAVNREVLERIFRLEDEQAAAEASASAAAQLAEQQRAAAEEAAAQAAAIAEERIGLENQLLELLGDTAELRRREMEQINPLNRDLQERINQLQDEQAAAAAAASAAAELAEQQRAAAEEAAAQARAIADERAGLELRLLQLQGDTVELRRREMEQINPLNRDLQERINQLQDEQAATVAATAAAAALVDEQRRTAEAAAAQARAIADERAGLETRLLQLQGDTVELRRRELERLNPLNRDLQERINQLQDEQAAAAAAAATSAELAAQQRAAEQELVAQQRAAAEEAASQARAIADERAGLESRLLQLQGDTAELRRRELDGLNAVNREVLERIFRLEDEQAAAAAAASAAAELAAQQRAAAEEAAAQARAIADERAGLESRLLQLQGNTAELRRRELDQLNAVNREVQERIYRLEDEQAAAAAAAAAAAELARAQEEQAAAAEALRKSGVDLEIRYLELLGDTAAATALRRQEERAATDASLQGWLDLIYGLEDAQVAQQAYEDAVTSHSNAVAAARDTLSEAYEREARTITETKERFSELGQELRDYRDELTGAALAGAASYRAAQVQFMTTAALARTGDMAGLGGLRDASSAFLEASRSRATSLQEYQRDLAAVTRAVSEGITATEEAVDYAELQLEALDRSVEGLIEINESVISVEEAIARLEQLMTDGPAAGTAPSIPAAVQPSAPAGTAPLDRNIENLLAEFVAMRREQRESGERGSRSLEYLQRLFERFEDPDGLRVVQVEPA
ncbi:hypothetical protein [Erythrobacter ramosus]|uniref:hypothetical protein n=1 Tax=Erythrobacter ramosus TaxID=35811 RepID=UPI0031D363CB